MLSALPSHGQPVSISGHDTLPLPIRQLSNLPKANDLEIDAEGNIYLLNTRSTYLHKAFASFNYDTIQTIGGRSNRTEGFLHPVRIALKNRQNLYLLDDAQRRIALLNTNLKLIRDFRFLETDLLSNQDDEPELLPVAFDVGPAGEIFMLNQLNNQVWKYNSFGEKEQTFGGLDYGDGSLTHPVDLVVSDKNMVFVSDTTNQSVAAFDLYGIYRYRVQLTPEAHWTHMVLADWGLFLFNNAQVWTYDLQINQLREIVLPGCSAIQDLAADPNTLFVLTKNGVFLYPLR